MNLLNTNVLNLSTNKNLHIEKNVFILKILPHTQNFKHVNKQKIFWGVGVGVALKWKKEVKLDADSL